MVWCEIKLFDADYTLLCGWKNELRFSSNSEANASELLENPKEIFNGNIF